MSTKQIILTSLRLQNVVLTKYHDNEDFFFVFGEKKFAITSFFAEFFSSIVSRLYKIDPTINAINFGFGTLCIFSKISDNGKQLVCEKDIKGGDQVFLYICDEEPVYAI